MTGKLILVEDQAFFRKGLRKMIEEYSLDWKVVGEAGNGSEALELIEVLHPNLVLTDIRMPGMSGIELAEKLHGQHPGIDVVILTGYDDFSYAQAAVRFGVIDFLLKPCNDQALMEVLKKAYVRLEVLLRQKEEREADQHRREEDQLRALLLRLPGFSHDEKQILPNVAGNRLLLIAVTDYIPTHKQYRPSDLGLLQFAIFNILTELLQQQQQHGPFISLEYDRFCILLEGDQDPEMIMQLMEQMVESYLAIKIVLHCSERIANQKELSSLYDSFVKMIGTVDSARKDRLEAEAAAIPAASGHRLKELQTQLTGAILLGNPDMLVEKVNELAEKHDALPLEDAKMEALALTFAMHQVAKQQLEHAEKSPRLAEQIERLQRLSTEKAVKEWTKEQAGRFLLLYDAWRLHNQEGIIRRSLEFLDKHYMEDCTLTDLANRVHVTPAYFSKLFKKETGDNYSTYLTKLRMQKAVLLLVHSDMKVFEIASSVGYDDPNYFTNVFRMLFKMSPSDYRKQLKS